MGSDKRQTMTRERTRKRQRSGVGKKVLPKRLPPKGLQRELDKLERTAPAVAESACKYDETVAKILNDVKTDEVPNG